MAVKTKTPPPKNESLHVYLSKPLKHALDLTAARNRRSLTAEVELALESHLKDQGSWPPKK